MNSVFVCEVDGGPSGVWWELTANPVDYPVSVWTDDGQLGRDLVELAREGVQVVIQSQAWWELHSCPECGGVDCDDCGAPRCDVCGVYQASSDLAWNGDESLHEDCMAVTA